jgi:hypothetical protein
MKQTYLFSPPKIANQDRYLVFKNVANSSYRRVQRMTMNAIAFSICISQPELKDIKQRSTLKSLVEGAYSKMQHEVKGMQPDELRKYLDDKYYNSTQYVVLKTVVYHQFNQDNVGAPKSASSDNTLGTNTGEGRPLLGCPNSPVIIDLEGTDHIIAQNNVRKKLPTQDQLTSKLNKLETSKQQLLDEITTFKDMLSVTVSDEAEKELILSQKHLEETNAEITVLLKYLTMLSCCEQLH